MKRKSRTISLVLVAVVALSIMATSVVRGETEAEWEAGGQPKRFRAGASPALVTGLGEGGNTFTFSGGSVKCSIHYAGTMSSMFEAGLEVTPTYSACTAFGLPADVLMEGCTYLFTLEPGTTVTKGTPDTTHTTGPMHIKCPAGTVILITPTIMGFPACTVSVPAQTPQKVVDTKNENILSGNTEDVLFTSTVEKVQYSVEGGGGLCGEPGKEKTDGKLDDSVTVKAYEDKSGTKGNQISFKIVGK